ncbi:hypothetical protein [Kitasatospora sp. NPDC008115]|uniref:hypothetical protein n=1 Tax=Kitasatospora sp. NPDC008115 TaxID=3364022 RepID=UPI0036EC7CCD
MARKETRQETCPLHTKYTTRNPGACPLTQHSTIQDHILALLKHHTDQPLDLRRWPPHRPTRRAIRTLAHHTGLHPRTLRRHAGGTRWAADPHTRALVDLWARETFCVDRIIAREARDARFDALAARRRAAATLQGQLEAEARRAALRRYLDG